MRGKRITVICLLTVIGAMSVLTAYSTELYKVFCRVTGYGGTTQIAQGTTGRVVDRWITVRFNTDTNSNLPWRFEPEQDAVKVRAGEQALAFFRAQSHADKTLVGVATFNVTPAKVGKYFNKTECFCFSEQTLDPGQSADMPVQFFIDPAIVDDPDLDDVSTITLSYTFFRALGHDPEGAPNAAQRKAASRDANGRKAVN